MVFLHTMFMSVWFGCLVALPRLYAEHARAQEPQTRAWYLTMERKMFKLAMSPAAVLTVLTGFGLLFTHGFEGGWLPVKLLLVTILVFAHLYQGKLLTDLHAGSVRRSSRFFHGLSLLPALFATAIIALVVGKPF